MSFNSKYFDRKAGSLEEAILKTVRGEAFEPHMMYDPKTGKGYKADTMDDHLRMKKMGYSHEAPKEESKLDELSAAQKKLPPALQQAIKDKEGKKEDVSVKEKLVGGQKKLDKDKDGDIDGKDFAMLRKSKSKSKSEAFEYGTPEATQNSLNMTPGQSTQEWDEQVGIMHKKHNTMREAIAKMWGVEEGNNPFDKTDKKEKMSKKEDKTMTGKPMTKVDVDPDIKEKK